MVNRDPLAAKLSSDTYLGFDFGNKKIGVSVGHADTGIASPLITLRSIQQVPDWQAIGKLIVEWQPVGLVVGISRQQDGSDNVITPACGNFAGNCTAATNCRFIRSTKP